MAQEAREPKGPILGMSHELGTLLSGIGEPTGSRLEFKGKQRRMSD